MGDKPMSEARKRVSEAKRRGNDKWDANNLKRMSLALPNSEYESLQEHIKQTGENRSKFIRRSIKETIQRDKEQ